ncbi:MAG: glycosyltransferase, partial [bacterium]
TVGWSGEEPNQLNMTAVFRRGEFHLRYSDPDSPALTLFAQGGSAMFRRDRFLALGGFCELFHPGYWEDFDLCYWAAKRGWRVIYNPQAVALHFGKASLMKLLGPDGIASLDERTPLLFTWLNLTDRRL